MKKIMMVLVAAMALTAFPFFADYASAAGGELSWVGCGITKKAFMGKMASEYEKETGVKVNLQGGGATRGIRDVALGKADMGGSCRRKLPVDEESNAKLVHVGWDALVVIVHPSNPVDNISADDIKAVFEGKITNWRDLGGPDMKLQAVARRGKLAGTDLMIRALLFKDPDFEFGGGTLLMKSSGPLEKYVEKERHAVAFTGVSSANKRNVKMLSLNNKKPTPENIASGEYVLYRPLYLVTHRNPSDKVTKFIKFTKSEKGQSIIAEEGTVNLQQGAKLWPLYRKSMKEAHIKGGY